MSQAPDSDGTLQGAQTLLRGMDVLDIVARDGPLPLRDLSERLGLTRSTAHRLAAALVDRDYLRTDTKGYRLGPKLLHLAERTKHFRSLPTLARPHLERLALEQCDAVNLAVREGPQVRYLDQARGARRIEIRVVIGETRWLASTALGKALMLDGSEADWQDAYGAALDTPKSFEAFTAWMAGMRRFRETGVTLDVEENVDRVRCVAAPIRGPGGMIVAAISLSSLPQYMDDARMESLGDPIKSTARAISLDLGWRGD